MFGTLFNLPSASSSIASIGEYSAPLVTDFLPFVFIVVGFALGILVVKAVVNMFQNR